MSRIGAFAVKRWARVDLRFLPFADAATAELPLGRLLRLSLFQVTVGMAAVLLIGTLNRVMIVELGVPAWLVSVMISLPLVFAPFRALVGFRSDTHRSVLGWRRVPYIWMGTLIQFGGLAIMPFALIVLSGDSNGPAWIGDAGAALAFLLVGAGLHTTQTVGMALATDLAPARAQPKVVALLCVMLLVGMVGSAGLFGLLLANFSEVRLIQVVQGAALLTMVVNVFALWKQEPRNPARTAFDRPRPSFRQSWRELSASGHSRRCLVVVGLGTAAFSMEDILLEPYGGQILHLPVGATTALTALLAVGGLIGLGLAARWLNHGADPYRVAALRAVAGLGAFAMVIFAAPLESAVLFGGGTALIGFGGGLFAHGTLTATMALVNSGQPEAQSPSENNWCGLALGTWGAVQASAAGIAIALSGVLRDVVSGLAERGALGEALTSPATGYGFVYQIEILLLFATLIAIGPLVRSAGVGRMAGAAAAPAAGARYALAELPAQPLPLSQSRPLSQPLSLSR